MKPPCPAPIVAAVVLLIVAGADTILAGGVIAAMALGLPALSPFLEVWLIAAGIFFVPGFLGLRLIRCGGRLLRARLIAPSFANTVLLVCGVLLTVLSAILCAGGLVLVVAFNSPIEGVAAILGSTLFALLNSLSLVIAGHLLSNNLVPYSEWQRSMTPSIVPGPTR